MFQVGRYRIPERTSNHPSVYTTEMIVIFLALQWVEHINIPKVVICSDSFAVLPSLKCGESSTRQFVSHFTVCSEYKQKQIFILYRYLHIQEQKVVDQIKTLKCQTSNLMKGEFWGQQGSSRHRIGHIALNQSLFIRGKTCVWTLC